MSRLRDAMDKYKRSGNNDFFFLKNDKDTATVRFLYKGTGESAEQDLDWYVVHEAEIGGKKRWVQCPETSDCPFCKDGHNPQLKIFIQLLDYTDNKVKTWERGQNFIGKLISNMERYGELYTRKFEIERNGEPRSTSTTYELFALDKDGVRWEDLPERQVLLGERGFVLQRGIEDMQKMVDGTFQFERVEGQREGQQPSQRRERREDPPRREQQREEPPHEERREERREEPRNEEPPREERKKREEPKGADIF